MVRKANLYEDANGDILQGYLLIRDKSANIPRAWLDRSRKSRKERQSGLVPNLRGKSLDAVMKVKDWENAYKKECFYYGVRVLLELERNGKSEL